MLVVINNGEYTFSRFESAVNTLEEEYNFEGFVWDMVKASGDFEILADFLESGGFTVELE